MELLRRSNRCVFAVLLAGSILGGGLTARAKDSSPALDLARQLNQAFVEVADKVSPAVVVITVTQKQSAKSFSNDNEGNGSPFDMLPPEWRRFFDDRVPRGHGNRRGNPSQKMWGQGSGMVMTEDGYILTNNHVVDGAEKIEVRFKDGKKYDAEIKGTDPESDVAIIKIKAHGLTTVKLGDSDKARVGEFAVAIGAPFELSYSVTVGHVSAKGRSFEGYTPGVYADQDFIQTDASINPGNSGGPLVNLYGEVIGINSMIHSTTGASAGVGFAVPINLAKRVADHLISEGKFVRSYIGVRIGELKDDQDYKNLMPDIEDGVIISAIEPEGPAAKSELKPSDVVVAVDGKAVKTARQLKDEISTKKVGQTVTLDVFRGSKRMAIKVKTAALPSENGETRVANKGADGEVDATVYGISVKPLTKEVADEYNVDATAGVIVTAVEHNSPAEEQGIRPGDIITEINRKAVSNPREFKQAVKASDPKKGMIVNLISKGTSKFVVLKGETE